MYQMLESKDEQEKKTYHIVWRVYPILQYAKHNIDSSNKKYLLNLYKCSNREAIKPFPVHVTKPI